MAPMSIYDMTYSSSHTRPNTSSSTAISATARRHIERSIDGGRNTRSMTSSTLFTVMPAKHSALQNSSRPLVLRHARNSSTKQVTLVRAHRKYTTAAISRVLSDPERVRELLRLLVDARMNEVADAHQVGRV